MFSLLTWDVWTGTDFRSPAGWKRSRPTTAVWATCCGWRRAALARVAASVALDPTFALGHAALALLGHELCAPVDMEARIRDARLHARRSTERERSHVEAVARHVAGDSGPLVQHLRRHPTDALLLSVAVPTIAFAGVTTVPQDAWEIVERCAPAYGDDWWFTGLLAFMRQEQGRFDEAMELSCLSLDAEPGAGHSAHARAHAHYETGDHTGGLAWMDGWITGAGAQVDSLCHFSWHAAMHELSMGDLDAVRRAVRRAAAAAARYGVPQPGGQRLAAVALGADAGQHRGAGHRGGAGGRRRGPALLAAAPFMAMHAAVALCAAEDAAGLATLARSCAARTDPTTSRSPLPWPARCAGWCSATRPGPPTRSPRSSRSWARRRQRRPARGGRGDPDLRAGGAGRYAEALAVIDRRLDRRPCRRDEWFQAARPSSPEIWSPSTETFFAASAD